MALKEDLERIAQQEKALQFDCFSMQTAWQLGAQMRELAMQRSLCMVIDIRRFQQPLFYSALEGTTPDNAEWARRKSNIVTRFHRSSYGMGINLKLKGYTLAERYGLPVADYTADGGAFPIALKGTGVIGSITVSGLPQREDHGFVVEALCLLLGHDYATLKLDAE